MTYAEFAKLAANIKTYFPRDNVLPSDRAMSLWYESLKDLDADAVMTGLKKYVLTNKFPPGISDLRSYAVRPPGQLREWAKMDIKTVNSVIYSNFLRAYSAAVVRQREDDNMPEYLKALEADIAARLAQSHDRDGKIGTGGGAPARIQENHGGQEETREEDVPLTDEAEIAAKMARLREKLYAGRHDDPSQR